MSSIFISLAAMAGSEVEGELARFLCCCDEQAGLPEGELH
jgi:hypothetical protein